MTNPEHDPTKRPRRRVRRLLAALVSLTLFACAGEGGDTAATGGMSGTGISQGEISSFGSIFVNGVQWSLLAATILLDDTPGSESDLR